MNKTYLAIVLVLPALLVGVDQAFAEDGTAPAPQIASAVEIAAAVGVVIGSLVKLADSWYKTPDNVDFDKRNHAALGLSIAIAVVTALAAYSQFNIPATPTSLFGILAINIPTGIGLQWGTNRTLQGFFKSAPEPTTATTSSG